MALVPAKCPECGGNINIDPGKKAAVCEYCKQPFIVQEAIQNFNTTYNITNNNEIKADVVNVYESKKNDFEIEAGVLKKYTGSDVIVTIPGGVKEIGRFCFADMKHLEKVVIPDGVITIGEQAFCGCGIKTIKIPSTVKNIEHWAFCSCKGLTEIVLPEGVETVSDAFHNCSRLEKVSLPSTLKKLDLDAFGNCNSLKIVSAPDSLKKERYVFTFPDMFRREIYSLIRPLACGGKPEEFGDRGAIRLDSIDGNNKFMLGRLCDFIISDHNPLSTTLVREKCRKAGHSFVDEIIAQCGNFLGLFGHYVVYETNKFIPGDNIRIRWLGYLKYCITNQDELDQYLEAIEQQYLNACRNKKICPYCRQRLSILNYCKNPHCKKQYIKSW